MRENLNILLLEDDEDDQQIFKDAIHIIDNSFTCVVATTVTEAIKKIKSNPKFDIIFTDLNLPEKHGHNFLNEIQSIEGYKYIPIVVYTTSTNPFEIERCEQMGASAFLTKPTSLSTLCYRLKVILEQQV